ncbi:MAG: DUF2723 domain-containing protein, partial [Anaerolineae bacterium]
MSSTSRFPPRRLQFTIAGLLALGSLVLYLAWLAPSVATVFDDSLEFQLVAYRLGIAHPTGYPLYTLLGKLFTLLPLGDVAYRVNLMSAVFGALAAGLVYLLGLALPPSGGGMDRPLRAGPALGAVAFALSPVFAGQATIAEVYTLNAAFVAAVLWLAVQVPRSPSHHPWPALALVYGLSLTHHRTMLLLLPALVVYLLLVPSPASRFVWRSFVLRPSAGLSFGGLAFTALAFSLPLLLYLYLPLRGHAGSLDGTYQNTWAGFWRQVGGGGYGVFIFGNPFGAERNLAFYLDLFREQFGWPGLILIALGIAFLILRRRWATLALTAGAFLTYSAFNALYAVSDVEVFFIPAFLIGAVWLGQGVDGLAARLAVGSRGRRWRWLVYGAAAAIILIPARTRFAAYPRGLDRSEMWAVHDYGLDVLSQPLPPEAAVVGILGEMTLLRYFQETAGLRPDLQTVAADREPARLAAVERLLAGGKTVFLTRPLPGAAERWSLSALGPLVQVRAQPLAAPPEGITLVGAQLTPEIRLAGYAVSHPATHGAIPPVRLTLYWQALQPVSADLKVSARLQNEAGTTIAAGDAVPVHFAYPTTAWRPGEVVADVYDLEIPPKARAVEVVTPLIILYEPARSAAEVGR